MANINSMAAPTRPHQISPILKAGIFYFVIVFGAGFVLGPVRILLIVPRLGARTAELLEAPLMLLVIVITARWVIQRFQVPPVTTQRVLMGLLALVPGLLFEFILVLKLRGLTLAEYLRTRDPVSGTVYYVTLGLFAAMPLLVGRRGTAAPTKEER
jgi:hypothetical protein